MSKDWPAPGSDRVLVLTGRPAQVHQGQYETLLCMLDASERRQMQRFRFASNRDEYLLAHALARWMLARCMGEKDPSRLPITREAHGKPQLAIAGAPAFSLSHGAGGVACAVTFGGCLGLDLEAISRKISVSELGAVVHSPRELARLSKIPETGKPEALALRWWTIKEAFLKADGRGLGIEPSAICCGEDREHDRGRLGLSAELLANPETRHYQGRVVRAQGDFWISWVVLGPTRPKVPVYGEWRGGETWSRLNTDTCWNFGSGSI